MTRELLIKVHKKLFTPWLSELNASKIVLFDISLQAKATGRVP